MITSRKRLPAELIWVIVEDKGQRSRLASAERHNALEIRFGELVYRMPRFEIALIHPFANAVLGIEHNGGTTIQAQLIGQNHVMRPKVRMAEPIVCVHVLVHAKKAGTLKIGATARFGCQDPQKGFFEQFAFSNTAARYEKVPLGWLMISEPE